MAKRKGLVPFDTLKQYYMIKVGEVSYIDAQGKSWADHKEGKWLYPWRLTLNLPEKQVVDWIGSSGFYMQKTAFIPNPDYAEEMAEYLKKKAEIDANLASKNWELIDRITWVPSPTLEGPFEVVQVRKSASLLVHTLKDGPTATSAEMMGDYFVELLKKCELRGGLLYTPKELTITKKGLAYTLTEKE